MGGQTMKKSIIAVLVLTVLWIGPQALAANWYVDNAAKGAKNGNSWTNAWNSFASIKWTSIACGDTIYVSGGATGASQTYAERVLVGKTCTEGSPLTITVGTDASHNGTVKITGAAATYDGILISSKNWITIDGQSNNDGIRHIEIYEAELGSPNNKIRTGITVEGTSVGVKVKYIYLHDVGLKTNDSDVAIYWKLTNSTYAQNHEISYCYIEKTIDCIDVGFSDGIKPTAYGGVKIHHNTLKCYDDGIQTSISTDIYNNIFTGDTGIDEGHPDGIQVYGSYVRIYNNLFTGLFGNASVYWEPDGDQNSDVNEHQPSDFWVYNNVFYETEAVTPGSALMLGLSDSRFQSVKRVYILNNTFNGPYSNTFTLGWGATTIEKSAVNTFYIMNNIFYNSVKSSGDVYLFGGLNIPGYVTTPVDFGGYGSGASIVVDYNSVYSDYAVRVGYLGGYYQTYSAFMAVAKQGIQSHGVTANPLVDPTTLKLRAGSPCIGTGTSAPSIYFTTDKDGAPRSTTWDIGAFASASTSKETTSVTPTPTPTPTPMPTPTSTTVTTPTTTTTTPTTTTTTKKKWIWIPTVTAPPPPPTVTAPTTTTTTTVTTPTTTTTTPTTTTTTKKKRIWIWNR